ncbi:endonuclease domain-containing protein [Enterovirga aerilata]|uniref:Endonuclease domain-containing protein n=1 Tax=Enterovirga aerilata TaxID=2730920 RepID=A0A849I7K6_9HYPH|nr:endonuclease domain-containing protein [Enterovirga sp. DB1703]NNM72275.1 endonuclease domain-containing protein [Enterovirga sp. DB1703]
MPHRRIPDHSRRFAGEQRREPTRAEEMLWRELRGRHLAGLKFRRQCPIGRYVVDFVCFDARLIVELDGRPHDDPGQRAHDRARDAWLRAEGFRVLRFPNDLLLGGSGDLVLEAIRKAAAEHRSSDLG